MVDNLAIYERARAVPDQAKKSIAAGRLKGMTDINPMFRIKKLTELFGPCGIGWWYDILKEEIVYDEKTNQKCAFVDILLYYKDPSTGEVSHGIPGTGGSSFVANERNGPYMSDDCYKMALTDALSVSCKALGIGADVYWDRDVTKYNYSSIEKKNEPNGTKTPEDESASEAPTQPAPSWTAKTEINQFNTQNGIDMKRFGQLRDACIAAEMVPDIPAEKMSQEQCRYLLDTIKANFPDALRKSA